MVSPRARIFIDNDVVGDQESLFQLALHLLSPSVEIRAIIASHLCEQGFGAPGILNGYRVQAIIREAMRSDTRNSFICSLLRGNISLVLMLYKELISL